MNEEKIQEKKKDREGPGIVTGGDGHLFFILCRLLIMRGRDMRLLSALSYRKQWISLGILLLLLLISVVFAHAQESGQLSITHVDSTRFPQVHVDLVVSGDGGGSLTNLTAADFQLFEDGIKVPTSAIVVERGNSQPVGLVMAIDVSTEAADLARIKEGLLALVNQFRAGDQGILLSFADDLRLEQSATGDPDQLRAAIQRLSAGGNYTSLNRAAVEAVNRAASLPTPHRVVVIVSDSTDNFSAQPGFTSDAAARQSMSVYLVAYSQKAQAPGAFDGLSQQINAKTYVVNSATEAQLRLQTLRTQFSQGYRLSFLSSLPADAAQHTISVNLANRDTSARADARMVATAGAVEINFSELANGQQIGGVVQLAPQISAPGSLQRVEFTLDGAPLATVETAPFVYQWETHSVSPGSHVIGVYAEDSAGNRAQQFLTLQVVDPLRIQANTLKERLYVDEEITVIADIEALNGVALVEFFLDDGLVGSVTSRPYQVTFDSSPFAQGSYIFTVQATDATGFVNRSEFTMDLAPVPPRFLWPAAAWLRILAFATILVVILLAWLLLSYLTTLGRRQRQTFYRLELHNGGNVATSYLLRADESQGVLAFFFRLNGLPLRGRKLVEWVPVRGESPARLMPSAQQGATRSSHAIPAPQLEMAPPISADFEVQGEAPAKKGLGKKLKNQFGKVTLVTRSLGGLVSTLAQLVPRSMGGDTLRQGAMGAQRVTSTVSRVDSVGRQVETTSRTLKGRPQPSAQGSQAPQPAATAPAAPQMDAPVGAQAVEVQTLALPVPVSGAAQNREGYTNGQTARSGGNGAGGYSHAVARRGASTGSSDGETRYGSDGRPYKKVIRYVEDSPWTETPEVEAGDTLLLEIVIEPRHALRTRTCAFRLSSKALAEPSTPLHTEERSVTIRGVSWVNWLLMPALVILGTLALILFMTLYLLVDFGIVSDVNTFLQQILQQIVVRLQSALP
jgi:hypothetical protein